MSETGQLCPSGLPQWTGSNSPEADVVARRQATAPEVNFDLRALLTGLYIAGAPIVCVRIALLQVT
jgi:hypothetical protein